jgi:hypothetical protein
MCFSETGQDAVTLSVIFKSKISTTKVNVHMILNHSTVRNIFNYKLWDELVPNSSFLTHVDIRNHAVLNSFDEYVLVILLWQENLCLSLEFRKIYDILGFLSFLLTW